MASGNMRRRWLQLALLALLPSVLLVFVWQRREPSYDGKTLTEWLSQPYGEEGLPTEEMAKAIRAMGKRVLPTLLDWLQAKESPIKRALASVAARQSLIRVDFDGPDERRGLAIAGLYVLGTNAAAAIPTLTTLIEDPELSDVALNGLALIGLPAWPVLMSALTNSHRHVRCGAANWLSRDPFVAVPGTLESLLRVLRDADPSVQAAGIRALADCERHADPIRRAFIELAADTNYANRATAINALERTGISPRDGVPIFVAAMENGSVEVRRRAMQRLASFASEAGSRPFLKALDDTEPAIRAQAASTLGKFPQEAAQIIPLLQARFTNEHPVVQAGAANGLARFGSEARIALPDLIHVYQNERRWVVKSSAARALLAIDPPTAVRLGIDSGQTLPTSFGTNSAVRSGRRRGVRTN